jgi:hypothetical protein
VLTVIVAALMILVKFKSWQLLKIIYNIVSCDGWIP